jgi:hypothetical protein
MIERTPDFQVKPPCSPEGEFQKVGSYTTKVTEDHRCDKPPEKAMANGSFRRPFRLNVISIHIPSERGDMAFHFSTGKACGHSNGITLLLWRP